MEELSQTQPVLKQMLWESREQDEQLIPKGLSMGAEPCQNWQDGGRDAEVETQRPSSYSSQHG